MSCALSHELQLCTALRYFVCGSFQIVVGDTFNISKPTVSRCVSNVCIALASLNPQFITFPEGNVAQHVKQDFVLMLLVFQMLLELQTVQIFLYFPQEKNMLKNLEIGKVFIQLILK